MAQPVGQADLKRRGPIGELHQHWRAPFEAAYLERWASHAAFGADQRNILPSGADCSLYQHGRALFKPAQFQR